MPELPEVETIVRSLREPPGAYATSVVGSRIAGANVLWPRTIANMESTEFVERITGQEITSLNRRGKFLVFTLTKNTLLIHLRMSGDLRLENVGTLVKKHDRLILSFMNNTQIVFNDTRKFGRVWLVEDADKVLSKLGPEPLGADFSTDIFFSMLQAHSRQIKPLLMDQHFLAGLGNIYTDEALHTAMIHPLAKSDQITREESSRLHAAIRSVLKEGILRNGASIDWVYRGGEFQNQFRVYGRAGEACPACGSEIQRLVVGQRGTHICPFCQVLPD